MGKEMRDVYQETLAKFMEKDGLVVMMDADLVGASGSLNNFKAFPKQIINAGISEANMISSAAGMSLTGIKPFVHTFAPFATRRTFDQLYMSGMYSKNNLHIYSSEPGIWAQFNGGTHTSFEDLALMRSLPGVIITAPCDQYQFRFILHEYINNPKMYYTRATRKYQDDIYDENTSFELGKWHIIRNGKDGVIFTMGEMVHETLAAAEILKQKGYELTVIDAFSIAPYDSEMIYKIAKQFKNIMVVENHNHIGGLGDLIAHEITLVDNSNKIYHQSIKGQTGEVGDYNYLKNRFGLDPESIANAWLENCL